MKKLRRHIERGFEKVTSKAISILGNSFTFMFAICIVIFWFSNTKFYAQDTHDLITDVLLGIAFLSLFLIQKSFNRFSASLHLKINELVSSHEPASNTVINTENKTEDELTKLSLEYAELAEEVKEEEENVI